MSENSLTAIIILGMLIVAFLFYEFMDRWFAE